MSTAIVPLISAIVSFIFTITVLDQFFARRKPYQLIWAIGLLMFFISIGSVFWIEAWGMNEIAYRLWYLFGAICAAAYLGMGTVYLLIPKRPAHIIMALLIVVTVYATFRVFSVRIDLNSIEQLSGEAMPQGVRLITPFMNIFGTVALVGGAIYSAWIFWRRKISPHRMYSNILIAVGAILSASGGALARFGVSSSTDHALFILLGIIVIFIGFLRSKEVFGLYRFPLIHGFRQIAD
ncbi:MAG: hypothetical protein V3R96_07165 [Dehalococcoidales bacterium]